MPSSPVEAERRVEPDRQLEIQLGHMCNNRCIFCVSGQRTAQREAFPIAAAPVIERLAEGRAQGLRKVTLLGGEPTLQPEFLDVVRAAVGLGFDEIVVFTNGAKTARAAFVDEVLATGGAFTWRLSFQGATALAHERTTKKLGSFSRLTETLRVLRARGQRATANMCVVRSNYESVAAFPDLLLPYGVQQLHLDMVRPLDAGVRTEDELRSMVPRYTDLAAPLARMIESFEATSPGFDVNIGNLPYCIAPTLAPWIHHDGEATLTVAIDDRDTLSEAWDKYLVKRRDKVKPPSCRTCVFDAQCSGVFDTYTRFYGTDELVPVTPAALAAADPTLRLFALHVRPLLDRLSDWTPPAPFTSPALHVDSSAREVVFDFRGQGGAFARAALRLRGPGGVGATHRFTLHLLAAHDAGPATITLLQTLLARLCADERVVHPVAADAGFQSADPRALSRGLDWRIGRCLARLRARAPFGDLVWRDVRLAPDGRAATAVFASSDGTGVDVVVAVRGAGVVGSYTLTTPTATYTQDLVESVRSVLSALRTPADGVSPTASA